MHIADTRWTPVINMHVVWCPCGAEFEHRADRWKLVCPECGERDDLGRVREKVVRQVSKRYAHPFESKYQ